MTHCKFPSMKVSIPQWCDCCRKSSKVWVIPPNVSIPQWCDCCYAAARKKLTTELSFNPTMVRLLRPINRIVMPVKSVSIPQWCDCCLTFTFKVLLKPLQFQSHNGAIAAHLIVVSLRRKFRVSIPQWCDCCGANLQRR